jgi:hypothetical protein
MTTLHVSRRTIALSYWSLAVLLPVLLMAVAIALEVLLFPRFAVSLENAALMLLGSLLFAGSFHCLSTVRCMTPTVVTGILTIIFLMSERFQKTHGWVICLAGLTGLFLTILGYLRAEKLVSGPVREKSMQPPGKTQKNIPPAKLARFNGAFLSTVGNNVLAGLLVATFVLFFKSNNHGDHLFWPFMFAFSGTMSCTLLRGQMRLLRSLPLSTKQLAAMLSLMPFVNVLALLAGLAVAWWVVPERFPNGYFAFSCMILGLPRKNGHRSCVGH